MAIKWLSWDLNTAMYYSQELKIQIRQKHSCWIFNSWKYRQVKEKPQQSLIKFIFQASKVKLLLLLSRFSHVRLCATPEMAAHQAPPSLGFSRQEHGSGLPFPSPMHESEKWKWSHSVMSDSSRPHGLQPTRLLHPWDFPGKSTGVGCQGLLRIFFSWHYNLQGKVWNPKCYENWYFIDNSFDGKV